MHGVNWRRNELPGCVLREDTKKNVSSVMFSIILRQDTEDIGMILNRNVDLPSLWVRWALQ